MSKGVCGREQEKQPLTRKAYIMPPIPPFCSVMEYFMKLIKKKFGKDVSKDVRAVSKLRREAERAKRALSSQHQVCVRVRACLLVCVRVAA